MSTQSSYFWWRHHLAAAAGSPYMVPEAAPTGPANPSATAPAAIAKVAVLAMVAMVFMWFVLFSFRCVAGWLRKGSDVGLFVISKNSWSDLATYPRDKMGGSRVPGSPHFVGGLPRWAGWKVAGSRSWSPRRRSRPPAWWSD